MGHATPTPDPAAALADLQADFPHVVMWHRDGHYMAHTRLGTMVADSPAELAHGLRDLRSGRRAQQQSLVGWASGGCTPHG